MAPMKKLIRFLLYFVGALVALTVLLSIALNIFIDPNDYRAEIETAVADATGRTLSIEGDLSLKTFPCCGVRLGPIALSNPEGFPDTHFVRVENAAVSVRLLPLILSQELQIGDVELDGLDLILISKADGSVNWEFGAPTEAAEDPVAESDAGGVPDGLGVAGVYVTEGRVLYRDEATGDEIEVGDITLTTSEVSAGKPFDVDASLRVSGLAPESDLQVSLFTGATIDLPSSSISLNGLKLGLDMAGLNVEVTGNGDAGAAGVSLAGQLSIAAFSPRELLATLGEAPMVTADPEVLTNVELNAEWDFAGDVAEINNLQLILDDTTATGWLHLTSLEKQSVQFDLQLDDIDVDRYLAPVDESESTPATSSTNASDDALDLPVEDMRALDVKGRLGFGRLRVAEALLTNVNINVNAKDGLLRMHPLTADIYGGGYAGDIRLDVKGATPKMSANENLTGFQLGEYLADTQDSADMEGVANLRVTAMASGNTVSALTENLAGDAAMDMLDGRYVGVDIWHEIRVARARIKNDPPPPAPENPATDISEFAGSAQFAEGLVKNRDLRVQVPFLRMSGAGDINIIDSLIDYRLDAKVVGSPEFDDGLVLDDLEGLVIPIKLQGALDDPGVSIDMQAVMNSLAKREANKEIDKQKERLLKKLGVSSEAENDDNQDGAEPSEDPKELLKQGLRGLFGK
jgi:AsmA protein